MNELEQQVRVLLSRAVGDPPRTLSARDLHQPPRPARHFSAPLAAVIAVVLIAVSVTLIVRLTNTSQGDRPAATQLRAPTSPMSVAPNNAKARAVTRAKKILDLAVTVPNSSIALHPPVDSLEKPPSVPGEEFVEETRFWTAHGTVQAAALYLLNHKPDGMSLYGSGHSSYGNGVVQHLTFSKGSNDSLWYSVAAFGHGVAVRADAQVLWAPDRNSSTQTIPPSVTSVDITIVRQSYSQHSGSPTVHRVITGRSASKLAKVVDQLHRAIPVDQISCPPDQEGARRYDALKFNTKTKPATVQIQLVGCSSIRFRLDGESPVLLHGPKLNETVLHLAGLPANYGDH